MAEGRTEVEATIKKTATITIVLTEREAKWLKELVQNPVGCTTEEELKDDKEIRKVFWNALDTMDLQHKLWTS